VYRFSSLLVVVLHPVFSIIRDAGGNFEFASFPLTVGESMLKRARKVEFVTPSM
jgi:hypothetical protein